MTVVRGLREPLTQPSDNAHMSAWKVLPNKPTQLTRCHMDASYEDPNSLSSHLLVALEDACSYFSSPLNFTWANIWYIHNTYWLSKSPWTEVKLMRSSANCVLFNC